MAGEKGLADLSVQIKKAVRVTAFFMFQKRKKEIFSNDLICRRRWEALCLLSLDLHHLCDHSTNELQRSSKEQVKSNKQILEQSFHKHASLRITLEYGTAIPPSKVRRSHFTEPVSRRWGRVGNQSCGIIRIIQQATHRRTYDGACECLHTSRLSR